MRDVKILRKILCSVIAGIGVCLYPEMEAAFSSKVVVNLYDTVSCYISEDGNLCSYCSAIIM